MKAIHIKNRIGELSALMERELENVSYMCNILEKYEDHNDQDSCNDVLDEMVDKLEDLAYEVSMVSNAVESWTF